MVMVIVMLFRLGLYTGRTGYQMEDTLGTSSAWPEIYRSSPAWSRAARQPAMGSTGGPALWRVPDIAG